MVWQGAARQARRQHKTTQQIEPQDLPPCGSPFAARRYSTRLYAPQLNAIRAAGQNLRLTFYPGRAISSRSAEGSAFRKSACVLVSRLAHGEVIVAFKADGLRTSSRCRVVRLLRSMPSRLWLLSPDASATSAEAWRAIRPDTGMRLKAITATIANGIKANARADFYEIGQTGAFDGADVHKQRPCRRHPA
jgi:hypothetical protein